MQKALIIDDHAMIRECIRHILKEEFPSLKISEAVTASEALYKAKKERWDIIIVDISMAGRTGLEIVKILRMEKVPVPIVVMSFHSNDQYARQSLKAGATCFIQKENAYKELISIVKYLAHKNNGVFSSGPAPFALPIKRYKMSWTPVYDNLLINFLSSAKTFIKGRNNN